MKNINYKIVALALSGTLLLSACETMQKASSAMGSTGTGVLAGVAAGAGTGILCDKLSGGNNTGACVAAGMAVGAAVGTWAASVDEAEAKKEPPVSCEAVKKSMNYPATATKPIAFLKLDKQKSLVVKPGIKFLAPVLMDLATPGKEGKEEEVTIKFNIDIDHSTSSVNLTRDCGGQATIPFLLDTNKEGVHNTTITLINTADNRPIQGGKIIFQYTVVK